MKILWLYGLMPGYDHNHWYHMDFVKILKQQNSQNLLAYGFATKIYPYRNLVTKILEPEHLIKKSNGILESTNYIECLQSYISHISDSSVCHVDVAKMFEIMASGSVLLADKGDDYGLKKLFPINSYCSYKRDGSDIIEMAKLIINNKDYVQVLTKNGVDCINKKHSHIVRSNELIKIVKDIL